MLRYSNEYLPVENLLQLEKSPEGPELFAKGYADRRKVCVCVCVCVCVGGGGGGGGYRK